MITSEELRKRYLFVFCALLPFDEPTKFRMFRIFLGYVIMNEVRQFVSSLTLLFDLQASRLFIPHFGLHLKLDTVFKPLYSIF